MKRLTSRAADGTASVDPSMVDEAIRRLTTSRLGLPILRRLLLSEKRQVR